jgi:uncharacterized membrane-anchored protein YjiN (DUF445 family)
VRELAIGPPPASVEEDYEERKSAFQEQLYEDAMDAYEDEEANEMDADEVAQEVIDNDAVDQYVNEHGQTGRKYVDEDLLRSDYDLSVRDATTAKKLIEQEAEVDE